MQKSCVHCNDAQSQLDMQPSPLTPIPGAAQQTSVSTVQAPEAQS